jgi:RNA polymerase sigma-70 factor, ECF subfamily
VTDAELVGRALAGSERAFREIVRRYERPVYALIARMVRDESVAEDLSQETFLRAFARLETCDRQRRFSSWLFRIAHNLTIDHCRRTEPPTVTYDDAAPGGVAAKAMADPAARSPEDAAAGRELARALDAAIGRLRPAYRGVLLLQYQEGFSHDEIAEITELPLGTVKTYLHRARKELAGYLSAAGWGA